MIEMTDERIYELAKRHFGGRGHSLIWQDDPRYAASCEIEKDARWSVSSVRAEQTLAFARSILAVSTEKTAPQLMESGPTGTDGSQKPNDAAAIPCAKAGSINSLPDSEIERIYRAEWYDSPVVARKAPTPPPLVYRFARACIAAHEAKKQQAHLVSDCVGGTVPGEGWRGERAKLRMQITNLERIKNDLEDRLFGALKTDRILAAALEEVDHAPSLSRGLYSDVLDIACVHIARVKELEAAGNGIDNASPTNK